jgi:hypothetical protein
VVNEGWKKKRKNKKKERHETKTNFGIRIYDVAWPRHMTCCMT